MILKVLRRFTQQVASQGVNSLYFTENLEELKEQTVTNGKSWHPSLLRRKSDTDLHTLWYVLLREKCVLLSDVQMRKQFNDPYSPDHRLVKVSKSMARIHTILKEREIVRNTYWEKLENDYFEAARPKQLIQEKKPAKELTEENLLKREKRKKAMANVKNWGRLSTKARKSEIHKQYALMAREEKQKFIRELRYLGELLKNNNSA